MAGRRRGPAGRRRPADRRGCPLTTPPRTTPPRTTPPRTTPPRTAPTRTGRAKRGPTEARLNREAWLDAAFSALADGGIDLIRIEALAKRLSVTKGGFYWHFRDRSELISTLLDRWRQGRIEAIVAQTRRDGQPARNRLNGLLSLYLENVNPRGAAIELAVRDWARRDGEAAAAVAAVDHERLRCVSELFAALDIDPDEAFARAFLFYSFIFGQSLLVCERTDPAFIRARDICARLLVG